MKYWIVDVFGREKYSGNQLAVVLADAPISTAEMQRIAQEFHFSETSFIFPQASRPAQSGEISRWKVRIFTPENEVPFAGHPTLGTAWLIRQELAVGQPTRIELDLAAGIIPVDFDDSSKLQWMRQIEPVFGAVHDPAAAASLCGLEPEDILPDYPVQVVSTGLEFLIIPVRSLDRMKQASGNAAEMKAYFGSGGMLPILLFCPETYEAGNSVNCRMFADLFGIPEDPATGSANGCLAAYLYKHTFFGKGPLDIRSEQGYEIDRKSILHLRAKDDQGRIAVHVGGKVFPVAEGRLLSDAPKNHSDAIHSRKVFEELKSRVLDNRTLIQTEGRKTESLNGIWNFTIDQYATSIRARWYAEVHEHDGFAIPPDYDFEAWEEVQVPSCWNTQKPEYFWYEGVGVYTRKFSCHVVQDERIFLHFDGIQYKGFVFLNKQYLGFHEGGSTPFSVEITEYVQQDNRILVVVDNSRADDQVPMSNTDWFNYGGLYRDVQLVRVPRTFLRSAALSLAPGSNDQLQLLVELDGEVLNQAVQVEIPELGISRSFHAEAGKVQAVFDADPELWTPENPRLYRVVFSTPDDRIEEHIGFRRIEVRGREVLLNGKPVFFRGVSCHEDSLRGGKYLSPEEIRQDMMTARELGCNYMRLAHYPHSRHAARIADELGLMLWSEIPVYWNIDFGNSVSLENASNQLKEMILRDRNRASIVIWSVGNENPDSDERLHFMKTLAELARELDPTRLVSAACLGNHVDNRIEDRLTEYLDIIGVNEYYGWYDPDYRKLPAFFLNSQPDKPVFVCEFGGGALAGHRGSRDDFFTEDRQQHIYETQLSILGSTPYVQGISPWILHDFRCPRRTNRYQKGYNRKGLLAEDKKTRKLAFFTLQDFYRKLAGSQTPDISGSL
ncbi:PhzF family phenazine biosynthesis isomerase [Spirochaeta dissipatitropha]